MPNFFTRKYLINREFQVPFIFRMVTIAAGVSVLLYLANFLIFLRFNYIGQQLHLDENHAFYGFIKQQFGIMNSAYLGISALTFAVLSISGLFLSHRIAGPLFHLKRSFKALGDIEDGEGVENLNEVRFRKNDFFQDLSEDYNRHLTNLKRQQARMKAIKAELDRRGIKLDALENGKLLEINGDNQQSTQERQAA